MTFKEAVEHKNHLSSKILNFPGVVMFGVSKKFKDTDGFILWIGVDYGFQVTPEFLAILGDTDYQISETGRFTTF